MSDQDRISPYNIRYSTMQMCDKNKEKYINEGINSYSIDKFSN